ncbi:long-chain fatty acid--CoA ligase [Xanthomonas hyacinthi]|uniref:AMP-dependent acyl-CoA synthetase n=1 Tax=Xanthomonas hyacinthi TaxID=56455 RepID=A0A2S7EW82_9XANT|nr:AMP-binding protein [Xanthomonas hyacinthi]KLD77605.1 AMP-dependent acyl-CoA synthetase [Xanthomonas hyacinthi DSM 19077]PPU97359.1 AMP-dependent acyl-CoA synthetase [Xanthomonas hyacinthi]QGY76333.1 long-chain fatty acid--CoA ligase [Xanthomonas hyacinthi]
MRLIDYLDKGASLGAQAACLSMDGADLSYAQVQAWSYRVARALARSGVAPGDKVAILSGNHAIAFACVFGVSRAGAVWCPINPRNEASENRAVLDDFDCALLIFHSAYAAMVQQMLPGLPKLRATVCLDTELPFAISLEAWLQDLQDTFFQRDPADAVVMLPGTGGTTGTPKGVMLTGGNLEAMTAQVLLAYPFRGRPTFLALAPLTHSAGVFSLPILALGGRIVVMAGSDYGQFLVAIVRYRVTHTLLPPTAIYMLLEHPQLDATDLSSLQCFWYGAAPISPERLAEALRRIGPMAQFFGQTEAPMVIATMAPADHYAADGSIASARLASAGRPGALLQVAIMNPDGDLLAAGERGEIVVRGSLVMAGYYKNPQATAEASLHGWHRTGDIGYLDRDGFLYVVDRAKDMVITGGFNVYSIEVEQALQAHPAVQDCAVIGLPDPKWGERIVAAVELRHGASADADALIAFVKQRLGGVKAPKQIELWPSLPRSKVGKIVKPEIRAALLAKQAAS